MLERTEEVPCMPQHLKANYIEEYNETMVQQMLFEPVLHQKKKHQTNEKKPIKVVWLADMDPG